MLNTIPYGIASLHALFAVFPAKTRQNRRLQPKETGFLANLLAATKYFRKNQVSEPMRQLYNRN
jgi:hypothetical protein